MTKRTHMCQVLLPWYNEDDELAHTPMCFTMQGRMDRRKAFRIIRRWYRLQLGITICKIALYQIWDTRHETFALDPNAINQYMHELAVESRNNEEIENNSDTGPQEETS